MASKHNVFTLSQSCECEVWVVGKKRENGSTTCSSQPFIKPTMSIAKAYQLCKDALFDVLAKRSNTPRVTGVLSLEETKAVLISANKAHPEKQITSQQPKDKHTAGWESLREAKADVTLDTKTGNPSLWTSKDGKRVRSFTHDEALKNTWPQRDPHKYDGWLCIQGSRGFTSGRHYWEVGVKGCCDWRIGVVRDSAPRHGFAKLTVASGYWTLRLQFGNLMALTSPVVTKLNCPTPTRVGVLLDMDAKQVVFFDAKQRKDVFTFWADFRDEDKIYPVFGTVETSRALIILD